MFKEAIRIGVGLMSLVIASVAVAEVSQVERYFNNINTLEADFEQKVFDQRQRLQQHMQGSLVIQRPGRFRWDYSKPYAQEIVADGEKIWFYDVDLEQVTVKSQAQTVGGTPALILSRPQAIIEHFTIVEIGSLEGLQWFELIANDNAGNFENLRLALDEKGLHTMRLEDSFGQLTELSFTNVRLNGKLDSAVFNFQAPDGVDVIDETLMKP